MALHGLMGEYNFARTVWGTFFFGGEGPNLVWFLVGSLDLGWPEGPLQVIAAG